MKIGVPQRGENATVLSGDVEVVFKAALKARSSDIPLCLRRQTQRRAVGRILVGGGGGDGAGGKAEQVAGTDAVKGTDLPGSGLGITCRRDSAGRDHIVDVKDLLPLSRLGRAGVQRF